MSGALARLVVDRGVCAGHGMCYAVAPALVEPDEQGDPVVLADPIPAARIDDADTAVAVCPERALSLILAAQHSLPEEHRR